MLPCLLHACPLYTSRRNREHCAGNTGKELLEDLDERAFSFFNAILDDVMRKASASPSSHESLGQALSDAMAQARGIWQKCKDSTGDAGEGQAGEHAAGASKTGLGVSCPDMEAAVLKHMRKGDEEPRSAFQRAVYWHWANLEYGCSADLDQVRP